MARTHTPGTLFFPIGLRLFVAATLVSLVVVLLGGLPQVRVLGAFAFTCAILGVVVSAIGLRMVNPLQWRAKVARLQWMIGMRDYPPHTSQSYTSNHRELAVVRSE